MKKVAEKFGGKHFNDYFCSVLLKWYTITEDKTLNIKIYD